jgi:hypothetical protein
MIPVTICITTFKRRLDLFSNLVLSIKNLFPDIQILVAINGENEESLDENYRKDILTFIASQKNIVPIMFTEFRSLSKLWNTLVIHSSTEYNLMLNDDIKFENPHVLTIIDVIISKYKLDLFTFNGSWSHFVVGKEILNKLGYFDERLIGHGEEDGDMVWRYFEMFDSYPQSFGLPGLQNLMEGYDKPTTNCESHVHNKPRFNVEFILKKYKDGDGGISGMFGRPMVKTDVGNKSQYPYELFWTKNKHNLRNFNNINLDNS